MTFQISLMIQWYRGAIFLNTLAYAAGRAMPGDEIIIHGIDSISINPDVLARYREKLTI